MRVEPKFEIPSGVPYTAGWCRPQNDGPALRAMALAQYGTILHGEGLPDGEGLDTSIVRNHFLYSNHMIFYLRGKSFKVWNLIKTDLDWVENFWTEPGCDLWEEVTSDDFFFNRMAYVYSLNKCADFADLIGDTSGKAADYRSLANTIKNTIPVSPSLKSIFMTTWFGSRIKNRDMKKRGTFGRLTSDPGTQQCSMP